MTQLRDLMTMIGRKRFVALVILLAVNGVLAGAWQKVLLPQSTQLANEKSSMTSQQSSLRTEIQELPKRYEKMKLDEEKYDAYVANGFLDVQDRIKARQQMDKMRTRAALRGISYNIEPQKKIELDSSYNMTEDFVQSEIKVSFKALTDVEVRDFVQNMTTEFGDLVILKGLALKIGSELNEANLLKLSENQPVDFITGDVTFDWYSIVPKAADAGATEAQAFGGAAR